MTTKVPTFTLLTTIGAVGGGLILLKDYFNGPVCHTKAELKDQTVIITGANQGIGKEVAYDLAKRKAKLILACRNLTQCEDIRKDIVVKSQNPNIVCKSLNLASLRSVTDFNRHLSENLKPNILINNAAIMNCPEAYTQDGFEAHFGVNYLGHFYLTSLLLSRMLKQTTSNGSQTNSSLPPLKIINVIDSSLKSGTLDFATIETQRKRARSILAMKNSKNFDQKTNQHDEIEGIAYDGLQAYKTSKLAMAEWSLELASRYGNAVKVYCVDPGLTNTNLHKYFTVNESRFANYTWKPVFEGLFMKDAKHGAQSIIYAVLDNEPPFIEASNDQSSPSNNQVIFITNKNGKFIKSPFRLPASLGPADLPTKLWERSDSWIKNSIQTN